MEEKEKKNNSKYILIGLGILSGSLLIQNICLRNKNMKLQGENKTLSKDREVLTEQVKKAWYHIGKIVTSKIIKHEKL